MYVCHEIHTAISCWWREEENSSHFREKLPHVVIGSYFMPGSVLMHHHHCCHCHPVLACCKLMVYHHFIFFRLSQAYILEYCLTLVSWWYWQSPAAGHCCCFRLEALLTLWRRRKLAVSQEQKQLPPHPRRLVLKYFLSFPRFSVNLSS